jgi:hypothetical protein
MERLRPFDPLRRLPLAGVGGWLLVAALSAWILLVTRGIDAPNGSGVRFAAVWLAAGLCAVAASSVLARMLRPAAPWLRPVETLAILAVVAMVLTDITMAWQPLRDLSIYLKAGDRFLSGAAVYMDSPLTVQPADRTAYPFLYPPPTLPIFAVLSQLPEAIAQAVWLSVSLGLALLAFRSFGVRARWLPVLVLWPPLFQGLWVGNVAVPALALFALAPRFGGGLVLGAVFKSYTGIAALWLVRERRWVDVAVGVGAVALLAVATLPLTGLSLWTDWIDGLRLYQESQQALPALYGFGLPRFVPMGVYVALAAAAVLAALWARGRESLARLGTATIVASPSLWGHGLLVAAPSMLALRSPWLWLAIGLTSTPDGLQWWLAIALVAASWALPGLRRSAADGVPAPGTAQAGAQQEPLHPLGDALEPWPDL